MVYEVGHTLGILDGHVQSHLSFKVGLSRMLSWMQTYYSRLTVPLGSKYTALPLHRPSMWCVWTYRQTVPLLCVDILQMLLLYSKFRHVKHRWNIQVWIGPKAGYTRDDRVPVLMSAAMSLVSLTISWDCAAFTNNHACAHVVRAQGTM